MRVYFLLALGLASCATPSTRIPELQRKLDEMQRVESRSRKKIEELEERVFLLTDQLESRRVAAHAHSAPRLPVVTLRAPEPEKQTLAPPPGEEVQPHDDVEYQGEARRTGPRPTLKLSGTAERVSANEGAGEESSENLPLPRAQAPRVAPTVEGEHENLGVAPAPTLPNIVMGASPPNPQDSLTPSAFARDPVKLYRAAHEDLRRERHAEAERAFRDFVRRFPQHDYADNAQYWLGETLYAQKRYQEAAPEFRKVVQRYPLGNKAPDAMLKLGFCFERLGDDKKAVGVLAQVGKTYPGSDAARLAAQKLGEK